LKKRRLEAQLDRLPAFQKMEADNPITFQQEINQLMLELGVYNIEIETLKSEQKIVYREIASAKLSILNLEKLAKLLTAKHDVTKKLYSKQYEGELALLEAEQKLSEAVGNIAVAGENLQRLFEKANSLDKQLEQLVLNFDRDVSAEISDISQKIQFAEINLDTLRRRVEEYEVKAPTDGIISKVFFNNVGEVVAQASTLGELIPEGRPLIFAAKLKPGDILEVTNGQETLVTLNNMDTRTEPPLIGRVTNVEKNSRVDENFGRYFQVEINFANSKRTNLIVPGVDGSASIILGKRSVIEYILEPIMSSFRGALSE
jgi:membrane fusion protein, adhesin transport system